MNATRKLTLIFICGKVLSLVCLPWNHTLAIAVFFGVDAFIAWHIIAPSAQGFGRTFTSFKTSDREVWLTIDDGPDQEDTPQILALLAHHQAQATFFVIGERAARYPHLINAINAAGHEIAHHTHTHPIKSLWAAGPQRLARELDEATTALSSLGVTPNRYRNPGGAKCIFQERALIQRGLSNIAWTIRSWDTTRRNPDSIVRRIMRKVTHGSIILVHESASVPNASRIKTIARLLVNLDSAGFRCVIPTTSQLR